PGFISVIAQIARKTGLSAYPREGTNRGAAVQRSDAARVAAGGLERAPGGARLPAVGEDGIRARDIAAAIGREADVAPASNHCGDVHDHFGWVGRFFAMDLSVAPTVTRELLGWRPTGPTLLEELNAGVYSAFAPAT